MEKCCITAAYSATSAVACPQSFFSKSPNTLQFSHVNSHSSSTITVSRLTLSVKADASSFKTQSLSSNWDASAASSPPSWLSSFEELDTTNMLLRQRIVFLGSLVDDTAADFIVSQLLLLDAEDRDKDITMFINSPGGSITGGMAVYDVMKLCKADISTICIGLAGSVGAFLLACGTKGKRFCMPNSRVMIHQHPGEIGGSYVEMAIRIREILYQRIKLNKILSRVTGKPYEQVAADTKFDKFMNPWEALEYGLIDEVIDDGKPGLVAPVGDNMPPPKSRINYYMSLERISDPNKLPSEDDLLQNGHIAIPQ